MQSNANLTSNSRSSKMISSPLRKAFNRNNTMPLKVQPTSESKNYPALRKSPTLKKQVSLSPAIKRSISPTKSVKVTFAGINITDEKPSKAKGTGKAKKVLQPVNFEPAIR